MKNNIREILDETNINIVDELNILEYIDELEKIKEDSLDKLDVLENRLDKAIEYCEDITSREIDISDTDYELGEDFTARDILKILRGEDNE